MRWAGLGLLLALPASAAAATEAPRAASVLEKVGFTAADQQRILAGEFVEKPLDPAADRDLAVALAFLARKPPAELDRELMRDALLIRADPNTIELGDLEGEGTLQDFARLSLGPAEFQLYAEARAGGEVNFSSDELAALEALHGAASAVEAQLCKILLGRHRAYRSRGLAGIAPYAREGGASTDAGGDLRRAGDAARALAGLDPALYRLLQEYPAARPAGVEESFRWSHYRARGQPVVSLTHFLAVPLGEGFVFVQRQFYVSRGYNAEQAIAAFVPATEGTLVVYTNHTFIDEVSGFGGGAKRAIGERLMASQLRALFEKLDASRAGE